MLESEPMKATEVQAMFSRADIGERTLLAVKKEMGIRSIKRDGVWYWQLPGDKALREDMLFSYPYESFDSFLYGPIELAVQQAKMYKKGCLVGSRIP